MGEAPTMPNSSPSKLALWMKYSLADLDKGFLFVFLYEHRFRQQPGEHCSELDGHAE